MSKPKNAKNSTERRRQGRHRAPQRHLDAVVWLGSGAITLAVSAATLAGGSGVAQADTAGATSSEAAAGHVTGPRTSTSSVHGPRVLRESAASAATTVNDGIRTASARTPMAIPAAAAPGPPAGTRAAGSAGLVSAAARRSASTTPRAATVPPPVATSAPGIRTSTGAPAVAYPNWVADQKLFTGNPTILDTVLIAALRVVDAISATTAIPGLGGIFAATPAWYTTIGLTTSEGQSEGMSVWTLQPSSPTGQYVIALHGGGYVNDPSIFHWLTYATMARKTGATVVVPMYPLESQGGTAATAVPQMADFLAAMVTQYGAGNVSVLGDSAGGGLALAAVQELVQRGDPTPGHMVLLSPWLDVTLSNPSIALINDPIASAAIPALKIAGLVGPAAFPPMIPRSARSMARSKDCRRHRFTPARWMALPPTCCDCGPKRSPRTPISPSSSKPVSSTTGRSPPRCQTPSLRCKPFTGSWASFASVLSH